MRRTKWSSTVLLGLVIFLLLDCGNTLSPDGMALLAFKKRIKDSNFVLSSWRQSDETPCNWTGVECNRQTRRVETLNLPRLQLVGTISPEIGKLEKLRRLGLHNNMLSGFIPSSIGNCSDLRAMYLRDNLLTGSMPSELSNLKNLRVLDVSENSLSGQIPTSLQRLNNLVFLNVSNNFLTGSITGFARFSNRSFIGNPGLCGQQLENRSCIAEKSITGFKTSKLSRTLLISALGTVTASLLLALVCFWGFLLYNKLDSAKACIPPSPEPSAAKLVLFRGKLQQFTLKQIVTKIEQLDYKDVVGAGGYGTVYKLRMDDGSVYAVKKIGKSSSISEKRLEKELDVLGSIEHRNLVGLRGYCNAPTARLLISDFMALGSLDEHLHETAAKDCLLTWEGRLGVAIGTARGLAHLHHSCVPPIIHRDIKSSNILLDKVTTIVAGTFGYLAPEYMQSGRATEKSDVYSYGVVLLELLSGKRPTDVCFTAKGLNIVGWASAMILQNRCLEIFDPHCRGARLESMEAVLELAAICIHPRPECRPTMAAVVKFLEDQQQSPCYSPSTEDESLASEFSLQL